MAFNLISGKLEPGDWSCGAANDVEATRSRPPVMKNAILGFIAGGLLGISYLRWRDLRGHRHHRLPLPENA